MNPEPHTPLPVKLILLVVVFPLALALFGGWQFSRVNDINEFLGKVDQSIATIERIQKEADDPGVLLQTQEGKKISASTLLERNKAFR